MKDIRKSVSTSLLMCFAVMASAEEARVDRVLIGQSVSAPSQYSDANEARAKEFIGEAVRIGRQEIVLPNQTVCVLLEPIFETWRNDMLTFGSFGGDWVKIGLQQSPTGFEVVTQIIDCSDEEERLVQLVSQPTEGSLWLNFGRVFVSLQ